MVPRSALGTGSDGEILFEISDLSIKSLMKGAGNPIYLIEWLTVYVAFFLQDRPHPARYVIDISRHLAEWCSGFDHSELVQVVYQVRVASPSANR